MADLSLTSFYSGAHQHLYGPKGDTGEQGPQGLIGPIGPEGPIGPTGADALSAGLFSALATKSIPLGSDVLQTSGPGSARYAYDASVDAAFVVLNPRWAVITANGRGFILDEADATPEMFDAKGDDVTDDTDALRAMSAYIEHRGGGTISLRPKALYRFGRQVPNIATFYLYSYPAIYVTSTGPKPVKALTINGNGATFKWLDNLKFGCFDTVTHEPKDYGVPFNDRTKAAWMGYGVQVIDVPIVTVNDLNIDGNSVNTIVGGRFNDQGIQLGHNGLMSRRALKFDAYRVKVKNTLLDCVTVDQDGVDLTTVPDRPHTFYSCEFEGAGRNVIGVVGGKGTHFVRCIFRNAGAAPNSHPSSMTGITVFDGVVQSSPASLCDLEAQNTQVFNTTFKGCQFHSAPTTATALVANTGTVSGIHMEDCSVGGVLWIQRDYFKAVNCQFHGKITWLKGGALVEEANSVLEDCLISDEALAGYTPISGTSILVATAYGAGVKLHNCIIKVARNQLDLRNMVLHNTSIHYSTGTDHVATSAYAVLLNGAQVTGKFVVYDEIPTAKRPAGGYYVERTTALIDQGEIIVVTPDNGTSDKGTVKWTTATTGAGGMSGPFSNTTPTRQHLRICKNMGTFGTWNGEVRIFADDAAPTTGTWVKHDYIINDGTTTASNSILGWRCTVAGTPGTWEAVRSVVQQATVADATGTAANGVNAAATPTMAEFNALVAVVTGNAAVINAQKTAINLLNARLKSAAIIAP